MLHKIYIRVIKGKKLKWMYFCGVSEKLWNEFNSLAHIDVLDFNAYLSMWAREDFLSNFKMDRVEHIDELKQLIVASCKNTYSELYIFEKYGLEIDKDFWIKLWVSSHLKTEILRLKTGG
jgi:hypothetical protein